MVQYALSRGGGRILCREATPVQAAVIEAYGSAMLPLLISRPIVFHSPDTESQRGLSQQVRELLVPSRLVLGEHPPFEGKVLDE